MRHDEVIRFRAPAALRKELEKKASLHGESLSSYLRAAAVAHARRRDPETDREIAGLLDVLRADLSRLGSNINQIAHRLNANTVRSLTPGEAAELASALSAVEAMREEVGKSTSLFREIWQR